MPNDLTGKCFVWKGLGVSSTMIIVGVSEGILYYVHVFGGRIDIENVELGHKFYRMNTWVEIS
jgi:hypothetical protein